MNLRAYLEKYGLSLDAFAKRAGVGRMTVIRIRDGKSFQSRLAAQICATTGGEVTPDELLSASPNPDLRATDLPVDFGAFLRASRGEMTQAEFASSVGVSRLSIIRWEAGATLASVRMQHRVVRAVERIKASAPGHPPPAEPVAVPGELVQAYAAASPHVRLAVLTILKWSTR